MAERQLFARVFEQLDCCVEEFFWQYVTVLLSFNIAFGL